MFPSLINLRCCAQRGRLLRLLSLPARSSSSSNPASGQPAAQLPPSSVIYSVPVRSKLRRFQLLYAGFAALGVAGSLGACSLLAYNRWAVGKRNEHLSWLAVLSLTVVLPASAYFANRSLIAPRSIVRSLTLSQDGRTLTVVPLTLLFTRVTVAPLESMRITDIGHKHVNFSVQPAAGGSRFGARPVKFNLLSDPAFIANRAAFRKMFRAS